MAWQNIMGTKSCSVVALVHNRSQYPMRESPLIKLFLAVRSIFAGLLSAIFLLKRVNGKTYLNYRILTQIKLERVEYVTYEAWSETFLHCYKLREQKNITLILEKTIGEIR